MRTWIDVTITKKPHSLLDLRNTRALAESTWRELTAWPWGWWTFQRESRAREQHKRQSLESHEQRHSGHRGGRKEWSGVHMVAIKGASKTLEEKGPDPLGSSECFIPGCHWSQEWWGLRMSYRRAWTWATTVVFTWPVAVQWMQESSLASLGPCSCPSE